MVIMKGYTPDGFKGQCYHIHMAPQGHTGLRDRLYFRDYLISHPVVAKEYEYLKLELALKFKNDREAYTDGKSVFVERITRIVINEIFFVL
jgi:GrpB-like predicted nucleotidyltransferase (UPF0157 family)